MYTMEYYSAIKKNAFESVLMRWMKLEPIIQTEVSQKEKHQYSIRNGNTLQCSCLENPRDGGAWGAAVYGVAQNRTQLKRLSSISSNAYIWNLERW